MQNAPMTPATAAGSIASAPGQRHAAHRDDRRDHDEARDLRDQDDRQHLPGARLEAAEVVGEPPHERGGEREQDAEHRAMLTAPRAQACAATSDSIASRNAT